MKLYNPNREERAFLYQEAQDLEPMMRELGSLSVMVEEKLVGQKTRFRVTFVVAPESVGMRVQAEDPNLFAATMAAKEETLRQLNVIVNSMPRTAADRKAGGASPSEVLH